MHMGVELMPARSLGRPQPIKLDAALPGLSERMEPKSGPVRLLRIRLARRRLDGLGLGTRKESSNLGALGSSKDR